MFSCGCAANASYKQGKQPSGSSPSFLCCSTRITPPFLPCLNAVPTRRLSLSLSHPGIPTFRHSMAECRKSGNPRFVFFLFLHSKRVAAAFSLPRARCLPSPCCCLRRTRGAFQLAIAFFFSLCAFCHLADLFRSFSPAFLIKRAFSGPGRTFPRTSTRRPRSPATSSSKHAASILGRVLKLELAAL